MNGIRIKKGLLIIISLLLVLTFYLAEKKDVITNIKKAEDLAKYAVEDSENDGYVLTSDDINVLQDKVEFSAFFTESQDNPYARKIKKKTIELGSKDGEELYFELNVMGNGYLEGGKIAIDSKNFNFQASIMEDNIVDSRYVGNIKTINLKNQVNAGSQKLFDGAAIAIAPGNNINNYHQVNTVTLTGTYVEGENRTPINVTRELIVDLTGNVITEIDTTQREYKLTTSEDEMKISFSVNTQETSKSNLILKDYNFNIMAPELNGYKENSVFIDGLEATYNEETGYYTYNESSIINDEGIVTKKITKKNSHMVEFRYPIEANGNEVNDNKLFTSIEIPVQAEYVGYSNINKDTVSSKDIKTIITIEPKGIEVSGQDAFNVYVAPQNDNIVSKIKAIDAYNGKETEQDEYEVQWVYYHGNGATLGNAIMRETSPDNFVSSENFDGTDSKNYDMTNVISNKGIYFERLNTKNYGSNAKIYVYNDDTNELIKVFQNNEISQCDKTNPFMYDMPLKHIRIETANVNVGALITINQIKEIEDQEVVQRISKEDFDYINGIFSSLTAQIYESNGHREYMGYADYEEPKSYMTLKMSDYNLDSSLLENQVQFYINVENNRYNSSGWKNGSFLIELPEDVILANITNVSVNNENVKITGYETYKNNNKNFIKILTSNQNEEIYRIIINTSLFVNPIAKSGNKEVKLYGSNEICKNYNEEAQDIYDINNNNEINENVGFDNNFIILEAPNNMITSQMASNYDEQGSVAIAPNNADININNKTIDININVINNYKGRIADTVIFGTIPYEENTYMRNNNQLGSQFTTQMKNTGIRVPEELEGKVTVYYTSNTNATDDLNDINNGWITEPEDWTNVKKYLIVFENPIPSGKAYQFTYTLDIPEGLEYNTYSYSEHCVNFAYETEDGKIPTSIEPAKLGIRVSRKYNAEITKLNKENQKVVPGAVYKLAELDENDNEKNAKLITSNNEGKLIVNGLYVNEIYTLEEVRNPENYSLNAEKIKFKVQENENNNEELEIVVLSEDSFSTTPVINADTLFATINEEPRYKITITKKDSSTQETISGVRFKLLPENKEFITDENGQFIMTSLDQREEYTLKETYSEGYYLIDDINFKLIKENGHFKLESNSELFSNAEVIVTDNEDLISIELELPNEGKPQLLIIKTDKETNQTISNVEYTISDRAGRVYTTNSEGQVLINGFEENTQYTINEIKADGYYLQQVTFTIVKDENGKLKIESDNEEFANASVVDETRKILKVNMTNEPIPSYDLNITKLSEGTTDKRLKGAIFKLFSEDTGKTTEYTTNDEGMISVSGLNAYKEGKNITGKYTLQEIKAPDGYSNNAEIIRFRVIKEEDSYSVEVENQENLETLKNSEISGRVLNMTIEDKPLFKLKKIDSRTKEPLANVEFIIIKLDIPVDYAKDVNGNYVGTFDEENNRYIVKTDENGEISLPLKDGKYYAIEVTALEGYSENNEPYYFEIITGRAEELGVLDTENNTNIIEIEHIEDLVAFSNSVNSGDSFEGKYVILKNDLDFNEDSSYINPQNDSYGDINQDGIVEGIKDELNNGIGFTPIGSYYTTPFSGEFDGNGKEIRNININNESNTYLGLFGRTLNAKIKNLGLTGNIIGYEYVGGIVGMADNTEIKNCYNKANITARGNIGGIIGYSYTTNTIEQSYNEGNITGNNYVGGLVGYGYNTTIIKNSYNTGHIKANSGNGNVGGLLGYGNSTIIENSYNTGDIEVKDCYGYIGGLAGYIQNQININNSWNKGNILYKNAQSCYVGGLVGLTYYNASGTIMNSYNEGDIKYNGSGSYSNQYFGGILGQRNKIYRS